MSDRLKPMFLIKPGSISRKDIRRAEKQCGVCIVECADTEQARYSDLPLTATIEDQARAALQLMRMVISQGTTMTTFQKGDLLKFFVDALMNAPKPQGVEPAKPVRR